MKPIFSSLYFILFVSHANAAAILELKCEIPPKEISSFERLKQGLGLEKHQEPTYLTIAKGLREGSTTFSSRNKELPWAIYFDLNTGQFVSSQKQESHLIAFKYFVSGLLTLPQCKGSAIEGVRTGIAD